MPYSKSTEKSTNKGFRIVEGKLDEKQTKVKTLKKAPSNKVLVKNEFVFAKVGKDSESPGSPSNDEARIYFKDGSGTVWKFTTSTKV